MAKNVMNFNNDVDFGIDFTDDHTEVINQLSNSSNQANAKAQALYNAIIPLLNNLKKNPEKPNIVWPDRVKKIDEFIEKLDTILRSN